MYFRAVPQKNSEDAVIFQEYTLYNVEDCGHIIRIVMTNADYQPGDYQVGLFGIDYQPIPEAQIPITEWKQQYGENTQPQKGDIIYIKRLHKLYEVTSSTVIYQIQAMPTAFKLSLSKYSPVASRRESKDLRQTIDNMTVSQEELFGDVISQEVADTVAEVETSYQQTSYVSPQKTFDMGSVVTDELIGPSGNRISNAYYNMLIADEPVVYKTPAQYDPTCDRPYWMFSCWLRIDPDYNMDTRKQYVVKKISFYFSDNKYWYFRIGSLLKLKAGDLVTLTRGSLLSLTGEACELPNEISLGVRFKLADIQQTNRKMKDWWKSGQFKVSRSSRISLIRSDNDAFSVTVEPENNLFSFKFGEFEKTFETDFQTDWSLWTYAALSVSPNGARAFMEQISLDAAGHWYQANRLNSELPSNIRKPGEFAFETLTIDCVHKPLNIRNIRLYENEYPMTDEIAL